MRTWFTRLSAVLAISVTLGVAVPAAAFAGTGGQSPSTQLVGAKTVQPSLKHFRESEKVISRNFQKSIIAAQAALHNALGVARTPGARSTARAQFVLAVITASTDRDAALVQLEDAFNAYSPANGSHDTRSPDSSN